MLFFIRKSTCFAAIMLIHCIGCGPSRAAIERQLASAVDILEHEEKRQKAVHLEALSYVGATSKIPMAAMADQIEAVAREKLDEINARLDKQTAESQRLYRERSELKSQPDTGEQRAAILDVSQRYTKSNTLADQIRKESYPWVDAIEGKVPAGGLVEREMMRLLDERDTRLQSILDERDAMRTASDIDDRLAEANEAVRQAQARVEELREQLRQFED